MTKSQNKSEEISRVDKIISAVSAIKADRRLSIQELTDEINKYLRPQDRISKWTVAYWLKTPGNSPRGEQMLALTEWLSDQLKQEKYARISRNIEK